MSIYDGVYGDEVLASPPPETLEKQRIIHLKRLRDCQKSLVVERSVGRVNIDKAILWRLLATPQVQNISEASVLALWGKFTDDDLRRLLTHDPTYEQMKKLRDQKLVLLKDIKGADKELKKLGVEG